MNAYDASIQPVLVESLDCTATAVEAAKVMRDKNVSFVVVTSHNRPIGILTDHDLTVRAVATGLPLEQLKIVRLMTPDVVWVYDDVDLRDASRLMKQRGLRRLLVRDREGEIVGGLTLDTWTEAPHGDLTAGELLRVPSRTRIRAYARQRPWEAHVA